MTIVAKFESTCPNCSKRIAVGSEVNWTRGAKATHVECPLRTIEERAETIVGNTFGTEQEADTIGLMQAVVNCDAEGNAVLAQAVLDLIEVRLDAEYDALTLAEVVRETPPEQRGDVAPDGGAAVGILKGIYRVSLTGAEKKYGVDHVNLQLVPNAKYGSVKVGEWQGESIGRVNRDGSFAFWPAFEDRTATRTYALLAALDIVRGSADPTEYAKAYAVASSACYRCGADLVDEKSRERLLGPECFRLATRGG